MAPFYYGWGSTASRLQPLRGGSLLFTTQFPEIPGRCSSKDIMYPWSFQHTLLFGLTVKNENYFCYFKS